MSTHYLKKTPSFFFPFIAALFITALFITTLFIAAFARADNTKGANWETNGSLVSTYQTTSEATINSEIESSADFFISRKVNDGEWVWHLEATTTPDLNGISDILPEANSDIGTALDDDNKGRLQLSEFYYRRELNNAQVVTAGLIDVSGFFEQSRIASDETTQFLGASFTGNPTIKFPDYSLGLVYENAFESGTVLRAALASSDGLADNSNRSYSQLLSVAENDKGLFAITSVSWKNDAWLTRAGVWANTKNHQAIKDTNLANIDDNDNQNYDNYGSYILAGYKLKKHALNIRLGLANEKVSQASKFTGIAYQFTQGNYVLGTGAARLFLSKEVTDAALGDTKHYEIYLRYSYSSSLFITGDIQQIDNSNFGETEETRDKSINVTGVRLSYLF